MYLLINCFYYLSGLIWKANGFSLWISMLVSRNGSRVVAISDSADGRSDLRHTGDKKASWTDDAVILAAEQG